VITRATIGVHDGGAFAGWQSQAGGKAIQDVIEKRLAEIFKKPIRIHGSGRTDSGVHARAQVFHFDAEWRHGMEKLLAAFRTGLPATIQIKSVRPAAADFHARFDAAGKQYRYFVWNHPAMNPLLRHQAWQVPRKLDLQAMRAAARLFVGKHDFKSLAATRNYETDSTVRTLRRCELKSNGSLLTFIIEGDGFLYKMCRGIVGTLVQVGQGKIAGDEIHHILASKDRRAAGMTAPACGLVLWKVFYLPRSQRAKSKIEEAA